MSVKKPKGGFHTHFFTNRGQKMTLYDLCKQLNIKESQIDEYFDSGVFYAKSEYDEKDLARLKTVNDLREIGMSSEKIAELLGRVDSADYAGQIRILREHRFALLDDVHNKELLITRTDYFIDEIILKQKCSEKTK